MQWMSSPSAYFILVVAILYLVFVLTILKGSYVHSMLACFVAQHRLFVTRFDSRGRKELSQILRDAP